MLFLPPVRLSSRDWARLMRLAFDEKHTAHPVGPFLRTEVHRAIVLDELGHREDVVRLNAWVKYQLDARPPESRFLVHPEDYAAGKRQLSVLSPIGAALIGIRVGDPMPFVSTEGQLHLVTALTVGHVPARRAGGPRKTIQSLIDRSTVCCQEPRSRRQ
jgi:hypothetical protein